MPSSKFFSAGGPFNVLSFFCHCASPRTTTDQSLQMLKPTTTQNPVQRARMGKDRKRERRVSVPIDEPRTTNQTNSYQQQPQQRPILPWWDHNGVGFLIYCCAGADYQRHWTRLHHTQVKANVRVGSGRRAGPNSSFPGESALAHS